MPTIDLNILQERELARLLDYERATCTVDGDLVYHCAFPYRPDDDLQVELIAHGALMQKIDDRRGTVVTITSDGYSYFPMLKQEEEAQAPRASRNAPRGHRRFVRRPQRSHRLSVGKVLRLARPNAEAASLFLLMHAFVKRMRVQRCV